MSHPVTAAPPPDPAAAEASVRSRLRALWTRRLAGALLDRAGAGLLVAATLLLGVGVYRFLHGQAPFSAEVGWNLLGAALLGVVIYTLGSAPTLDDMAAWIDRRAGTHDRFHTALDFAARPALTPLETLTLAECAGYVERFPVRRWTPLRLPRALPFVLAPLVSLALLAWHASLGIGQPPRDRALDAAVTQRADALAKIADRLHRDDPRPSPDLARIADAMKRAAERLKESAAQPDAQKLKTALGELSSLQAMLAAMKQAQPDAKISPGELAALAAALAASDPSRAAGESVKQGQLEQAGDQLEKLAEQMKAQGGDAQALQQLAQSMQEQAGKLSEQEKNEVARQMQQAAQSAQNGQAQLSAQAMQRLAELLRRAGRNGANGAKQASSRSGAGGGPISSQQLQDLLNALENMKEDLQPGEGGQNPGEPGDGQGGAQSLALVESFAKQGSGDPSGGDKPSGMPGGEHDSGTNDHLLADHAAEAPKPEGPSKRLEGVLGDGASLQELVGATAGPARASRGYRNLYEAIAPAEQNSVEQENIPLGSRYFVRRYFESIRPQN